jgi:pantoate--beta-alanine ligase
MIEPTIAATRAATRAARLAGKVVGLVPTMGALHEGHRTLIETCRGRCDFLVVSIYVNPKQFNDQSDLARYPRTPEADHTLCREAGVDLIFEPPDSEMYPRGHEAITFVEVPGLSDTLEGASRAGHFRGVSTVVSKLFHIVEPDLAAFGRKDFQQLAVIRRMAADQDMPVSILPVETVREADGLAMSSRNRLLTPEHRRAAPVLHRALQAAWMAVKSGERGADRVRQILTATIESEAEAEIDYAEVADANSLQRAGSALPSEAVALLAVRFGPVRLIDNLMLLA